MTALASEAELETPRGLAELNPEAHKLQRRVALAVMLLPALGMLEAARLAYSGALGAFDCALFAGMYFVHMGGVTMGLHRMVAHRAFQAGPLLSSLLVIMGSTSGQGPLLYWVSTHRAHHAYSDREGDPHSPHAFGDGLLGKAKGLWYSHMPWMLSRRVATWAHFSRDVLSDRRAMFLHQNYLVWLLLGLLVPALLGALAHQSLFGAWIGFVVGGLARMFLANQAAWCVGSVAHVFGARPFQTQDRSANNWFVALAAFGEGLQNNHHAFPSSYRHAIRWWEPDLSGYCLRLFERLGWIWDVKVPSRETVERFRAKQGPDTRPEPGSIG